MSSRVSNIRTYHKKYFDKTAPTPETIGAASHMAGKESVNIANDGRAYAPFKRPLTKAQMQALNARKNK